MIIITNNYLLLLLLLLVVVVLLHKIFLWCCNKSNTIIKIKYLIFIYLNLGVKKKYRYNTLFTV